MCYLWRCMIVVVIVLLLSYLDATSSQSVVPCVNNATLVQDAISVAQANCSLDTNPNIIVYNDLIGCGGSSSFCKGYVVFYYPAAAPANIISTVRYVCPPAYRFPIPCCSTPGNTCVYEPAPPSRSVTPSISVTPSTSVTSSISTSTSVTPSASVTPSISTSTSTSVTPSISTSTSTSTSVTPSISITPSISTSTSTSVTPSPSASQTMTFEGFNHFPSGEEVFEYVLNYYNGGYGSYSSGPGPNYGVVMGSNIAAFRGLDYFGEPSPVTISFALEIFRGATSLYMNVAAGFTTFSAYYTCPDAASNLYFWSGLNASGTLLLTVTLPASGFGNSVPGCNGASYCPFVHYTTTFPSAMSMSVQVNGNYALMLDDVLIF